MRYGSIFCRVCLTTTGFLAGCGETAQPTTAQPTTAQESSKVTPTSPEGDLLTNSLGIDLVLIPAGEFILGSPESEHGREVDETQHTVTLTLPFSIGVHEVTQSQYEAVMGSNPSKYKGAQNPVEHVSWEDAVAFCEKVSALPEELAAGRVYRLPTEAEWEFACRAGTATAYSFGDDDSQLGDYAWFGEPFGVGTTHPVGTKLPNRWGIYDMHGNVWEWCSDSYGPYASEAASDPQGATTGSTRVNRGGSWSMAAKVCRAAYRGKLDQPSRTYNLGFRLAMSSASLQLPEAEK